MSENPTKSMNFNIEKDGDHIVVNSTSSPIEYFYATIHPDKKMAFIFEANIVPSLRGKGYGKQLVNEFTEVCKKYGVSKILGIPEKSSGGFWPAMNFDIIPRDKASEHDKDLPYKRSLSPLMVKNIASISYRQADILQRFKTKYEEVNMAVMFKQSDFGPNSGFTPSYYPIFYFTSNYPAWLFEAIDKKFCIDSKILKQCAISDGVGFAGPHYVDESSSRSLALTIIEDLSEIHGVKSGIQRIPIDDDVWQIKLQVADRQLGVKADILKRLQKKEVSGIIKIGLNGHTLETRTSLFGSNKSAVLIKIIDCLQEAGFRNTGYGAFDFLLGDDESSPSRIEIVIDVLRGNGFEADILRSGSIPQMIGSDGGFEIRYKVKI